MNISSYGMNFLGLTTQKYTNSKQFSDEKLNFIKQNLESFSQIGENFKNAKVDIANLRNLGYRAFYVKDGNKLEIDEKAWDKDGVLQGQIPLEEGISSGIYQIEPIQTQMDEIVNIDKILADLEIQRKLEDEKSKEWSGFIPFAQDTDDSEHKRHRHHGDKKEPREGFKMIS